MTLSFPQARANVPTICERTIRNDIAASAITLDASIQVSVIQYDVERIMNFY